MLKNGSIIWVATMHKCWMSLLPPSCISVFGLLGLNKIQVNVHILVLHTFFLVIYLDFLSAKRTLWLANSWWRAPDQIQMYPDRDAIAQLLPACRIQQHVISPWLNYIQRKHKAYIFMKTKIKVKLWKRTRTKKIKQILKTRKKRKGKLSENIQNISRCWFSQSSRGLYLSCFLVYFYFQLFSQSIPFRSLVSAT